MNNTFTDPFDNDLHKIAGPAALNRVFANPLAAMDNKLVNAVLRHGIGAFDNRFFERVADAKSTNYPPHNILQISDDQYRLTVAVAGFTETELDITMQNDLLTVSGQKQLENAIEGHHLLYNGIAFRDFSRQFKVGDHVSVDSATLKDGLLQIELMRRIPETMKAKKIAIGASTTTTAKDSKPRIAA